MNSRAPNLNAAWASILVEELVRCGVEDFCVAPGSRSAPLALAISMNSRARATVHVDERALAYFALGRSRATRRATALITTSGTATANLWPAVMEASLDDVPLLLLTADRPPELRDTGANQTADQVKLFGSHVRWFADVPCPDAKLDPASLLTTVDQAVHRARTGPVHLNCMFREPLGLEPDDADVRGWERKLANWRASGKPFTAYSLPRREAPDVQHLLKSVRRGLVVVGALRDRAESDAVARWTEKLGWPVVPDVLSGLRLRAGHDRIAPFADLSLLGRPPARPDLVLHLGGRVVSKRIAQYVAAAKPKRYLVVHDSPRRMDPEHLVTDRVECGPADLPAVRARTARDVWAAASRKIGTALDRWERTSRELSEPLVGRLVTRLAPEDHALFLGNSMPIRDVNLFGCADARARAVFANRGASGIDGTLATGLGCASPGTILIGDLALLHDLNALALARERRSVIVALNNNGGGIFSFLPVAKVGGARFERFFGTPHGLSFESAADLFGIAYVQPRTRAEFESAYRAAAGSRGSTLIEVRTDRAANLAEHQRLQHMVRRALA